MHICQNKPVFRGVAQREDCPTSGQLELTLFNPLDHLESPRCTAHWDYPRIIRATKVIYVSVAVFLLVFGTFVCWSCKCWWHGCFGAGLCDPVVLGMGAGCTPFLFALTLKGSCQPPRGQSAGVGWVARGPPPVTIKWFIEKRHNPSSCKPQRRLMS